MRASTVVISSTVVVCVAITAFVILSIRGVETANFVTFLVSQLPSALIGLVLLFRTDKLKTTLDKVEVQGNGNLEKQREIAVQALDVARTVAGNQTGNPSVDSLSADIPFPRQPKD